MQKRLAPWPYTVGANGRLLPLWQVYQDLPKASKRPVKWAAENAARVKPVRRTIIRKNGEEVS